MNHYSMLYVAAQWKEMPQTAVKSIAALDTENAIEKMHQYPIDILILKKQDTEHETEKLARIFNHQFPEGRIILIDDQDVPAVSAILNECILSFEKKIKPIISIRDDAFEISSIPVHIQ